MDGVGAVPYEELCSELSIDKHTRVVAWHEYMKIKQTFSLEGDQILWLTCALYTASRGKQQGQVRKSASNCVSLTKLLRCARQRVNFTFPRAKILTAKHPDAEKWKLVLIQFFTKMRQWVQMTALDDDHTAKIERLERNFSVSSVLFSKFTSVFHEIFKPAPPKIEERRRKGRQPCTFDELFQFTWTVFIHVKGTFPGISDDLVNCFHLLLACLDWIYENVMTSKRSELIDPNFTKALSEYSEENKIDEDEGLVPYLCEKFEGVPLEAKVIKMHHWRPCIQNLFAQRVLLGKLTTFTNVLETTSFHANVDGINRAHERFVMTLGDFDERIFLGEERPKVEDLDEVDGDQRRLEKFPDEVSERLLKLKDILRGHRDKISDHLWKIISRLEDPVSEIIECRLVKFCETYLEKYPQPHDNVPNSLLKRVNFIRILYYQILEGVILHEKKRFKRSNAFHEILHNDTLHRALFVCSLEIVAFSYCENNFLLILNMYNLQPIDFYKVVESVVRSTFLGRSIVRHLNEIVEMNLESLVWKNDSRLWLLINTEPSVPTCQQVMFMKQIEHDNSDSQELNPKRRLFTTSTSGPGCSTIITTKQCILGKKPEEAKTLTFQSSIDDKGNKVLIPVQLVPIKKPEPQRRGPVALFFRHIYYLASRRLRYLCINLDIDDKLRNKIFTCFEYCLVKHIDLFKDRHLDQILMCAIFIVLKVCEVEKFTFQEMVNAYKLQSNAKSHVYRDVLLKKSLSNSDVVTSSVEDNVKVIVEEVAEEERGDIVTFYNQVFVDKVKKFVMKFTDGPVHTSAFPIIQRSNGCPMKPSAKHQVFISPVKKDNFEEDLGSCSKFRYRFEQGLSCDLRFLSKLLKKSVDKSFRPVTSKRAQQLSAEPIVVKPFGVLNGKKESKAKKRAYSDENDNHIESAGLTEHSILKKRPRRSNLADPVPLSYALREKLLGLMKERVIHENV